MINTKIPSYYLLTGICNCGSSLNTNLIRTISSYDVIFTTPLEDILQKFKNFNAKVVFGAERLLWPKQSLEKLYPPVVANAAKYLNSGLFMGEFCDLFKG